MAPHNRGMRSIVPTAKDLARFWAKVDKSGGCWLWTAALTGHGYGNFFCQRLYIGAHVFSKWLVEAPPEGRYELDHVVCETKACVNPAHTIWVPVAGRPNSVRHFAKQTHCKHGHELTPENTYRQVGKDGRSARSCKKCRRAAEDRFWGRTR